MKICFVLLKVYSVFCPELKQNFGGAEAQFYLLSRQIAKDPDFEATCVSRDYGQPREEWIEGVRQLKIPQGGKILAKLPPLKNAFSTRGLYKTLKTADADVYLQFCAGAETGIVARHCVRAGKAFIHQPASDRDVDGGFEKKNAGWKRALYRYGVGKASLILCQNAYQQTHLRERFGKESRIIPSLADIPPEYAPPSGKNILWVSRLLPMKNPGLFFDLARKNYDYPFVMIAAKGPDPEFFRKTVEEGRSIANLTLIENVPYREIDRHFAEARVFVNTSDYEGFPNTFLESMKFGVPILSLKVDPDAILTREKTGLLAHSANAEGLHEGLQKLLHDQALHATASRRAYAYMATRHDLRKIAEEYKAIFRKLTR